MWRCTASPDYTQEVYLPQIEEIGFTPDEEISMGFFLPPYTFEKYSETVSPEVEENRAEIIEDPTDDLQPFANAMPEDVRIYSMSAFCHLGQEGDYTPSQAASGEIPDGHGFHHENIKVPVPQENEIRSQEYQFIDGSTVEGVNAPLPITGTIDGEAAQAHEQITCLWQYQYGDGEEETGSEWFTGGDTENIAADIDAKLDDRNWNTEQMEAPGSTISEQQINELEGTLEDPDIQGWQLTTHTPENAQFNEDEAWEQLEFDRPDFVLDEDEGSVEAILCRMSRWLPIENTGC